MKVKCIENMGTGLSELAIKAGYNANSIFHLKVGAVYTVYGMNLWRNVLSYLTMNQPGSQPIWSPAELFEMVDGKLPPEWYYVYLGSQSDLLNAAWGYQELTNGAHYIGIQTGDAAALKLFFERKKAIDAFSG
jgi:hypothetical protein